MNPESVDYDRKSGEVFITFTDESENKRLEIILFKDEAWDLHKMIQESLRMKSEEGR